jgi:hypothetical protein
MLRGIIAWMNMLAATVLRLRGLDHHPGAAISSLIMALSCRRCVPNAPFANWSG